MFDLPKLDQHQLVELKVGQYCAYLQSFLQDVNADPILKQKLIKELKITITKVESCKND